ncbi:MAG: acyl--CoA ligase [Candidatus Omnitrophica bacterium]|nr:acyl--CoA ligase [Candidatus Omnitrophota bacterium]
MLIHNFLKNSAKLYPDKAAVVHQDKKCTYQELDKLSDVYTAILLDRGVQKGERVIIFLDNGIEYIAAYFSILKTGAVVVALNSQLVSRELKVLLNDCTPKIIISDKKHSRIIEEALTLFDQPIDLLLIDACILNPEACSLKPAACSDSDLAMIIYTSGTTGTPKGVMLSHRNICVNTDSIIKYLELSAEDKIMVVLPFYYSYGNSLLTTHIKAGGTLVIDNRFMYPNVVLDTMLKEEVTGFAGVPSTFMILIKKSSISKYIFPKLRYVTQAGGAMPAVMIEEFLKIIPRINFFVMYGQTEAAARLSYLHPGFLKNKAGSIGKAIPGVELEVINEQGEKVNPGEIGEIVARGDNVMKGYWNAPKETELVLKKQGLFTGDLAKVDEDGFIYLVSRKKDMIKSGANRISPFEIEEVVYLLPEVEECAAVGIPDDILGESIKIFVAFNGSKISDKEIMIHCKKNLAAYKLPKFIEVVGQLPKTASGKIKREELKSISASGYKPQAAD